MRPTILGFLLLTLAGGSPVLAQTADFANFSYEAYFAASAPTLSASASTTGTTCEISVNGADSRQPTRPFTFYWGDSTTSTGFFPATHRYTTCTQNYTIEVRPNYGAGPVAQGVYVLALFRPPSATRTTDVQKSYVEIPEIVPDLPSRVAGYHLSNLLNGYPYDELLGGVYPSELEYVLSIGGLVQRNLSNLGSTAPATPQVLLLDPGTNAGAMYSAWFVDPWALVAGTRNGSPGVAAQLSSYLHEMGHNFTLNLPTGFYYGGRIDGPANTIYSETMAQIYQHATGYEMVRNYAAYGLGSEFASLLSSSLRGSMGVLRSQHDAFLAANSPYQSWNNPATSTDETTGTFMSLAYIFLREAHVRGLGYRVPVQRMMEFLALFNDDWLSRYAPQSNATAANRFRAALMVAAVSHGLQSDMRSTFQGLNFPIDTSDWNLLTGANLAGVGLTPGSLQIDAAGGTATVSVQAPAAIAWTASTTAAWIQLEEGTAGRGPRTLRLRVLANTTGAARSAEIHVGNATVAVQQSSGSGGGPVGNRFIAVPPCRIADTRNATGPFGGPALAGGVTRSFSIPQSACGIPVNAKAYSLNVTVVPRGYLGYLTLAPAGGTRPLVSTLNSPTGKIIANAALVPAGTGGAVDVFATDTTDVILDINGYFAPQDTPGGLAFYALPPCRISDTRNATGSFGGPTLAAGAMRSFPVPASGCNVPASAQAYSLNATVVPKRSLGFLTLWPAGQGRPLASTLNSPDGSIVANAAIVPAGSNGAVSAFVTDDSDLILDINGYFAPPTAGGLSFYPATPCRIADTREATGAFGGPVMSGATSRTFAIASSICAIPATAQAFSLNATVVPAGPLGFLTLWPAGGAQPFVSTLNSPTGNLAANAALVPAGSGTGVSVYVTHTTHLIVDINGYFAP